MSCDGNLTIALQKLAHKMGVNISATTLNSIASSSSSQVNIQPKEEFPSIPISKEGKEKDEKPKSQSKTLSPTKSNKSPNKNLNLKPFKAGNNNTLTTATISKVQGAKITKKPLVIKKRNGKRGSKKFIKGLKNNFNATVTKNFPFPPSKSMESQVFNPQKMEDLEEGEEMEEGLITNTGNNSESSFFDAESLIREAYGIKTAKSSQHKKAIKANSNPASASASKKIVCKYWMEGKCEKGSECIFSHDIIPRITVQEAKANAPACRFHILGTCLKGSGCMYSHDLSKVPCRFFHVKGTCSASSKCRFSHQPIDAITMEKLYKEMQELNRIRGGVGVGQAQTQEMEMESEMPIESLYMQQKSSNESNESNENDKELGEIDHVSNNEMSPLSHSFPLLNMQSNVDIITDKSVNKPKDPRIKILKK